MIQPQERIRLLVVDDDEGMVATLRDILGASGYGVDVAFSGREAVEQVKTRRPDGILMDIHSDLLTLGGLDPSWVATLPKLAERARGRAIKWLLTDRSNRPKLSAGCVCPSSGAQTNKRTIRTI